MGSSTTIVRKCAYENILLFYPLIMLDDVSLLEAEEEVEGEDV